MSPTLRTAVNVDHATRDRFKALAELTGTSMGDIIETLSYADLQLVLQTVARRAAHEVDAGRKGEK